MLGAAAAKLNEAGAEAILDFSALKRIDAGALKALEKLADAADSKGVKLALAGVGVDVYKALKVMKIARRFSVLH
jgi:anti-anti-sigma regulatory factor